MTRREKHIFQMITRRIKELDAGAEVILYGSHARGQAKPESDWDILVLLNQENVTLQTEQKFRHHLLDLELEIEEPVSVMVRSKSEWNTNKKFIPIYKNIKAEGVKLK